MAPRSQPDLADRTMEQAIRQARLPVLVSLPADRWAVVCMALRADARERKKIARKAGAKWVRDHPKSAAATHKRIAEELDAAADEIERTREIQIA